MSFEKVDGRMVCMKCGFVLPGIEMEMSQKWRSPQNTNESHSGAPPNLMVHDRGLSTTVGEDYGIFNKETSGHKSDMRRIRMWQRRIIYDDSKERNLTTALWELQRIGADLNIPSQTLEKASLIYRKAMEMKLIKGRSIKKIMVSALYVSIRLEGLPITIKNLSQSSGMDRKELTKNFRLLLNHMQMKLPITDPLIFIRRICSRAKLNNRVMLEAAKIMRMAREQKLIVGTDPLSMASASVYYACMLMKVETSFREISDAADITGVTLRNRYKNLVDKLNLKGPITTA